MSVQPDPNIEELTAAARRVIEEEARTVASLASVIGDDFFKILELILACRGRVITTGMGKAGLIARKVSATLASTGTPAFFVHPAEAVHGDLGMVTSEDLIIAFSHRGQTEEVIRIIPYAKFHKVPLVAITSRKDSDLARAADAGLILRVQQEACPLNLTPTSSTIAMLAIGDTLAMTLLEARGFHPDDYARFHPGGPLGRRLLTTVGDLMHKGEDNPVVTLNAPLREAILAMTSTGLACASVADAEGRLAGFFSDGDLRRLLLHDQADMNCPIHRLMTRDPKFAKPHMMAVKGLEILREYKIIELPVVDDDMRVAGLLHLHDLTRAGIT